MTNEVSNINPSTNSEELVLSGISILELAAIGPVPFASMLLQQMGAKVTVLASPKDRNIGLPIDEKYDYLAHDKRVIYLDLKSEEGKQAFFDQLDNYDVVLEGFRPGTLERMGLSPDAMLQAKPELVIGRCGGWGDRSPRAKDAGHDINYLALSGSLAAIGDSKPTPPLNLVGDFGGAAMHLATGVLGALLRSKMGGKGAVVNTSIYEGTISLMTMIYGFLDGKLWQDSRASNLLDGGAPFYQCYKTKDDKWMAVGAIEAKFFAQLIDLMDLEVDLSRQYDVAYWPQLQKALEDKMLTKTRDEWDAIFRNTDACCTPVLSLAEARAHSDTAAFFKNNKPDSPISFSTTK